MRHGTLLYDRCTLSLSAHIPHSHFCASASLAVCGDTTRFPGCMPDPIQIIAPAATLKLHPKYDQVLVCVLLISEVLGQFSVSTVLRTGLCMCVVACVSLCACLHRGMGSCADVCMQEWKGQTQRGLYQGMGAGNRTGATKANRRTIARCPPGMDLIFAPLGVGLGVGGRGRGNDTSRNTDRRRRRNTETRRSTRREERVAAHGPVKRQQPDGSHARRNTARQGRPERGWEWATKDEEQPLQQSAQPQYPNYWAPPMRKRHGSSRREKACIT